MTNQNSYLKQSCTNELRLLISIINEFINKKGELEIEKSITTNFHWDQFLEYSKAHKLIPIVNKLIRSNPSIPAHITKYLFHFAIRNSIKNKLYTEELFKLYDKLESNNITAVPMCGAFLALEYYKDLSLRTFVDLDLMLYKADILKVKNCLNSDGYKEFHPITKHDEYKIFKNGYEHTVIKEIPKTKSAVLFELHWNLLNVNRIELPVALKDLEDGIIELKIDNKNIKCFNTETTLLINLIDGGVKDLWYPFKHIVDLALIMKRTDEINWQRVIKKMNELRFKKLYLLGFYLLSQLFEQKLPIEIQKEISKVPNIERMSHIVMKSYNQAKPYNSFMRLRFCLSCIPKFKAKILFAFKYIRSYLLPKKHDYADFHLPKSLSFLYLFVRIKRVFIKYSS